MNNAVGCAAPARRRNRIVLGTDGIGADMLDEIPRAYVRHREDDDGDSPMLRGAAHEFVGLFPRPATTRSRGATTHGAVAPSAHARCVAGGGLHRQGRAPDRSGPTRVDAAEIRQPSRRSGPLPVFYPSARWGTCPDLGPFGLTTLRERRTALHTAWCEAGGTIGSCGDGRCFRRRCWRSSCRLRYRADAPRRSDGISSRSFGRPDGFSSWWSGTAAPVASMGERSAPGRCC